MQGTDDKAADLAAETLSGDIASFLVDRIRHLPKVWDQMTEDEQIAQCEQATEAARRVVRDAVNIIAADGRKVIHAVLGDIKMPGKSDKLIQAKINISRIDEQRHQLFDAAGFAVKIVVADAEPYMGGEAPEPDKVGPLGLPRIRAAGESGADAPAWAPVEDWEDAEYVSAYQEISAGDDPAERIVFGAFSAEVLMAIGAHATAVKDLLGERPDIEYGEIVDADDNGFLTAEINAEDLATIVGDLCAKGVDVTAFAIDGVRLDWGPDAPGEVSDEGAGDEASKDSGHDEAA